MRYLFILTQDEGAWEHGPAGEAERVYEEYMALERELRESGALLESVRLRPSTEARTLRNLPGGKRGHTPGPYVQSAEALGGFYILECGSLDEALRWAERMPNYGHGSIEVRPVWD
jgi:hypothetical protein